MTKTAIFISFLILVAFSSSCSKKTEIQESRWSGEGQKPSLSDRNLKLDSQVLSQNERVYFLNQYVGQYPVYNAFAKTIMNTQQDVVFQSFALIQDQDEKLIKQADKLSLTKNESFQNFLDHNPDLKIWTVEKSVQVVISPNHGSHAAYLVELASLDQSEIYQFLFSKYGRLEAKNRVGSGFDSALKASNALAYPKGPKKSSLENVTIDRLLNIPLLGNHQIKINPQSPLKINPQDSLEIKPDDERFEQVQAFYSANEIIKWLVKLQIIPETFTVEIQTHAGYPDNSNASFYYGGKIRLGAGDNVTFSKIALDPSIVMHETSHAVIDLLARLPFEKEGGSINEGYADFFTTLFLQSPLLGENAYLLAPYKRSVETVVKLSEKNGGLYHDSAIVSSFFWSLQKQIDKEKVLKLAVKTLSRLGPNTTFADFTLSLNEQATSLLTGDDLQKTITLINERGLVASVSN